ncbi:MAG: hypothetical protein KKE89_09140, partial [Actinobacteria bacterium]|nr:hypothetical protein [Actinomycetota bacterium]
VRCPTIVGDPLDELIEAKCPKRAAPTVIQGILKKTGLDGEGGRGWSDRRAATPHEEEGEGRAVTTLPLSARWR